jgi:hypothetical protein
MHLLEFAGLALLPSIVATAAVQDRTCKCFPGDACWPSEPEWDAFNATVDGRLIKTVPLGSPCHDPHYDETLCGELTSQWGLSPIQYVWGFGQETGLARLAAAAMRINEYNPAG